MTDDRTQPTEVLEEAPDFPGAEEDFGDDVELPPEGIAMIDDAPED